MQAGQNDIIRYHRLLPTRIRKYLIDRGISGPTIDKFSLGWNGQRITIPIYDRRGQFAFFRLAKDPDSALPTPKMLSASGTRSELFGWESLRMPISEIVICEGEFDRLVLETHGFAAVTSTAGAGSFSSAWASHFQDIPYVFVCFDKDEAGRIGAERVARLIPHARIVQLPTELGHGGDVTDYFIQESKAAVGFRYLLDVAQPLALDNRSAPSMDLREHMFPSATPANVALLKAETSIEWLINQFVPLHRSGQNFVGKCPFHPDRTPSLVVFPRTQSFHCFGCRATGDSISFLMRLRGLSFLEALETLTILLRL